MYLRGCDRRGAAASLNHASATGFTVSGCWSDQADFAVLVLHDSDDLFGHLQTTKYLPSSSLAGVTLDFDLTVAGAMHPVSTKYQSVPWGALRYITADEKQSGAGTVYDVSLASCATSATGMTAASASFTLQSTVTPQAYDRVQLIYLGNIVFDYINYTSGQIDPGFQVNAGFQEATVTTQGAGYVHFIQIAGVKYTYTEAAGDTPDTIRDALISAINGASDPFAHATAGADYTYNGLNYSVVQLRASATMPCTVPVSASDGNNVGNIEQFAGGTILQANTQEFATLINTHNWSAENVAIALMVTSVSDATFTVKAARFGKVDVSGAAVTWQSGQTFVGCQAGDPIMLAGVLYTISSVNSATSITLTRTAGALSNVAYLAPGGGRDGNSIELLTQFKTSTLQFAGTGQTKADGWDRSDVDSLPPGLYCPWHR
jgi:hypothetical protein